MADYESLSKIDFLPELPAPGPRRPARGAGPDSAQGKRLRVSWRRNSERAVEPSTQSGT